MNEKIKEVLDDEEVLLWTGKPEKFDIMDKTNKTAILTTILASFSIVAILSFIYAYFMIKRDIEPEWVLIGILFAVAAGISYNKFAASRKVARKLTYAITNQRLFTLIKGNSEVSNAFYSDIKEARFFTDADGHTSLVCGQRAIKFPASRLRFEAALKAAKNEQQDISIYVMYAIPEPDKVKEVLRDYLPIVK